ncbi:MAG: DUF2721 domain-containing protein [candidate division WOR-3 bacterium]|nr:MAG: DUF2721 domain-containing protein [candidate division WOR-3 bacterium]
MDIESRVFSVIQAMLSPAVMISCSGLLLLALTPKLGRVIDRIRLLNQEKTGLAKKTTLAEIDTERLHSIEHQIEMLVSRAQLLKRSSGATLLAILFFVITSAFIGFSHVSGLHLVTMTLIAFMVGMFFVFAGVGFAYWEIRISHDTITEEIEASKAIAARLLKKSG